MQIGSRHVTGTLRSVVEVGLLSPRPIPKHSMGPHRRTTIVGPPGHRPRPLAPAVPRRCVDRPTAPAWAMSVVTRPRRPSGPRRRPPRLRHQPRDPPAPPRRDPRAPGARGLGLLEGREMSTVTALLTNKAYGYPTRGATRRRLESRRSSSASTRPPTPRRPRSGSAPTPTGQAPRSSAFSPRRSRLGPPRSPRGGRRRPDSAQSADTGEIASSRHASRASIRFGTR